MTTLVREKWPNGAIYSLRPLWFAGGEPRSL